MCFFNGPSPEPIQFKMLSSKVPSSATVAILFGINPIAGGAWKLVYVLKHLKCVHVYECIARGRQWWYSLHMTTDVRFTLREMDFDLSDRKVLMRKL